MKPYEFIRLLSLMEVEIPAAAQNHAWESDFELNPRVSGYFNLLIM